MVSGRIKHGSGIRLLHPCIRAMQDSYSSLFGYESGERLPIVHTQLASFDYGDNKTALPQMHLNLQRFRRQTPQAVQ